MRTLIHRLAVLLPALAALLVLIFALVPGAGDLPGTEGWPRFLNPAPRDVRDETARLATRIAVGASDAPDAAAALVEIGGAALPHLLPALDTFAPGERGRIAMALLPVARRMGLLGAEEELAPAEAVAFWYRVYRDRAADYRPEAVARAVRRLSDRSLGLRRAEVKELDTLALADLMNELRAASRSGDVPRMRRLCRAARDIVGHGAVPEAGADLEVARAVARQWWAWWLVARPRFTTLDGFERPLAVVTHTRFATFLEWHVTLGWGNAPGSNLPLVSEWRRRALASTVLLAGGLALGFVTALLAGTLLAGTPHRWRPGSITPLLPAAALLLLAWFAGGGWGTAALAVAAAGAVGTGPVVASTLEELAADPVSQADRARGWSRAGVLLRSQRRALPAAAAAAVGELPLALAVGWVAEVALDLPALGPMTAEALRTGNVLWLVGAGLHGGLALAVAQLGRDVLVERSQPLLAGAFHRERRWEP